MKSKITVIKGAALAVFCGVSTIALSAEIAYISSSSGYVIHNGGGGAVTANWRGQAPIRGFGGYGQININGGCLTGRQGNQPLTFEACRQGDRAQIWKLERGQLNNEVGWCADVEGNRGGAGIRVLAWQCSGASNQRFRSHIVASAQNFANSRIPDPRVRAQFVASAQQAAPGQLISVTTGQLIGDGGGTLVGQDGAGIVAAGGGNIVAAGGGNIVAAGGGNVRGTR